jgi:SAM-dependent methyltransferase
MGMMSGRSPGLPLARTARPELLDAAHDGITRLELAANLRDIRRANRYFGGTRAVVSAVQPFLVGAGARSVTILDVATGSADIPLALVRQADRHAWRIQITATDLQPEVLAIARAAERPGVLAVEPADARALPYADNTFDVVLLSLALHHFEPEDALRVLAEMRRVGRRGLLVNDLERTRVGLAGAWLFSRGLTRNRLTRHDAPLSVRRAYTLAEGLALARAAGWGTPDARRVFPFRFVLTGSP